MVFFELIDIYIVPELLVFIFLQLFMQEKVKLKRKKQQKQSCKCSAKRCTCARVSFKCSCMAAACNFIQKETPEQVFSCHNFTHIEVQLRLKVSHDLLIKTFERKLFQDMMHHKLVQLVKFAVFWSYLWCICTHSVNTYFEISNIFRVFVIFARENS